MITRSKGVIGDAIEEKLRYLRLDFENIPEELKQYHNLNFRVLRGFDEKQYKQYRFINIADIDILLTPLNRLDDLRQKYEKSSPLYMYLDSQGKDNILRHTTFMGMLKKVRISEIDKIEKEQEMLAKKLPFKVKYEQNYLWQIYYSESADRYFMLVPTEDTEYATLFYLIKKKIENKKDEKIFVPISYMDYTNGILSKQEIRDIENYLWAFTKDYPLIYEVYDKNGNETLQIVGESHIYGKIKTLYKMIFSSRKEAGKFYKLLKALFILQTELPHYYKFTTNIEKDGTLKIFLDNARIEYDILPEFVLEQYMHSISLKENIQNEIEFLDKKLESLNKESSELETEYFVKEKQISTYLECKKTFFGKVKYYFKFGKKTTKKNEKKEEKENKVDLKKLDKKIETKKFKLEDRKYTLDELIVSLQELEILENNQKNTILDINAIKLKNKNLKKKIENASAYIEEINEHKKSIFEFWKYSNKDEVMSLEEGEKEEINVQKIEKIFSYDDDFEDFGENLDKNQRMKFTDDELEASFIATTEVLDIINKTYKKQAEGKDFSSAVKDLKDLQTESEEEFDVLGNLNNNKESVLGNKTHRELPRDKYKILNIKKGSRGIELKKVIIDIIKNLKKAIKKNTSNEIMYVYKATSEELDFNGFEILSLNEENELEEYLVNNKLKRKNNLYRIKLPKGTNFIVCSNIVYYENYNMTLPVGMNVSDKIIVDMQNLDLKETKIKTIGKAFQDNPKDDFSKMTVKSIVIHELEVQEE